MKRGRNGSLPSCLHINASVRFPADDSERYKAAQLADAKKGIYWGKYGLALKPKEDDDEVR